MVAAYLKWLGHEGKVKHRSLSPYLSVINTVHNDLGFPGPARGGLVKNMRQAYSRKVVYIKPPPRIFVMPARVVKLMWDRLAHSEAWLPHQPPQGVPSPGTLAALEEMRALLACVICFVTGSRPSSIALLAINAVSFAPGTELTVSRVYVKTAQDATDFEVTGKLPITWPAVEPWQRLGHLLQLFEVHRRRAFPRARKFFHLGERALTPNAFEEWLPRALAAVDAPTPSNGHYAPKSFRSGFASTVNALNLNVDRRNYIAGWAPNSATVARHYVDNSVVADAASRFFFGHLVGLGPPLEAPQSPLAAFSRLASRVASLVSPLRVDSGL